MKTRKDVEENAVFGAYVAGGALTVGGLVALARRAPVGAAAVVGALLMTGDLLRQLRRERNEAATKWIPPRLSDLRPSSRETDKPPSARLTDEALFHAMKDNASEVVIEPQLQNTRIRYKIAGEWRELMSLPSYASEAVIGEVKARALLDLQQTRQGQEGFLAIRLDDEPDEPQVWRVNTLPSPWGEAVVMKVADNQPFDATQHPLYQQITQQK